ncbi:MAG: L,D-transpeptidase [Alphaproteobacteria bacterium]|nr:L,D-transpeptidase [Alphaproteobacteria bacterium]
MAYSTPALARHTGSPALVRPDIERMAGFEAYAEMYRSMPDERFPIPAARFGQLDPMFLRQISAYRSPEPIGTVIVDTQEKMAYLTLPNNLAVRYGVGIGRAGFSWSGRGLIKYKKKWPTWTPPAEMIARQPEFEIYRNGMEPGLDNPLGARALYIFQDGRDTLYRLHGTGDPNTIGKAVSSGCVRFLHQDIIDLYNRVPNNTPLLVV